MDVHPTKNVSIGIDPCPNPNHLVKIVAACENLPSGYDIHSSPWKDPPIFKNGKPSISMGHLYHGYVK